MLMSVPQELTCANKIATTPQVVMSAVVMKATTKRDTTVEVHMYYELDV